MILNGEDNRKKLSILSPIWNSSCREVKGWEHAITLLHYVDILKFSNL